MTGARDLTLGLILAGGRGRRMGGADKALIPICGEPILSRVAARLAPQCDGLILNANGDPARFAAHGLPVIADSIPDYAGPLAGVLAAVEWAAARRPDASWIVSVTADGPFPPRDLVARLHAARAAAGADLASASSGGRAHPATALWPVSIAASLRRALTIEGERKVARFASRFSVAVAEWDADPVDPFFNINAPDDAAEAERLARAHPEA